MVSEEIKATRGRPKKKEAVVENESREQITMAAKNTDRITLENIQARWRQAFAKYGTLGFESINTAWNSSVNFLSNPFVQNARVKQINSTAQKKTKEELAQALADPTNAEQTLRSVSMDLYYTNYIYQTLTRLNREVPKYNYYATPLYLEEDYDKESLLRDSRRVDKLLKKFNPPLALKTIATQVAAEGKSSYLVRTSFDNKDVDFFLLQKLNSDRIKITGFGSKQQFIASFNMIIFLQPGYNVSQYPKCIQDAWEEMNQRGIVTTDKKTGAKKLNPKANLPTGHILEMQGDSYMYWVQLDQNTCYTFYSDGAHPNAFPDTLGLFEDFNDLEDYRWLQGNLLSKGVTSVLTAEAPITRDAKAGTDATVISVDTILGYQDFFTQNISANIFPFFSPFQNAKLHTLEAQPEALNIIYNRIRDLISTSGNSALLTLSEKPTVASTLAAEKIQAAKADYLTRQFESFLNNVINENFGLKYEWKIRLHSDIFLSQDDEKLTKELVIAGAKGLIPKLLSYEGLTVEDYRGAQSYLDALGIEIKSNAAILGEDTLAVNEKLGKEAVVSKTSETASVTEKKVGRPSKEGNDVTNDNTAISREAGNNVSALK